MKTNQIPCVLVNKLSFAYPANGGEISSPKELLSEVSFQIDKGEVVSICGANGCGKSTLLNILAGFIKPDLGTVSFPLSNGKIYSSFVFQDLGLMEWKTAYENVELALLSSISSSEERKSIVEEYLNLLGVFEHKDKLPKELSGGLKQRVAIARALAPSPKLLLLDEPFSALDWKTKKDLQKELLRIIKKKKIGVVLVTHDLNEAAFFSDRVFMISNKKLVKFNLDQELN
jgi:ABC-type nitrate/sulfonate/bicarbonate transport system ATPase subunit